MKQNVSSKSGVLRRQVLGSMAGGIAGLLASSKGAFGQGGTQRPNILFLISDDHSADDLGCVSGRVRTPNLDKLAQQGTRFPNCFVTSPQCSPNRSAILTGCTAHTIGTSRLHSLMPKHQQTFVDLLKQSGYFTGAYRKVHQGAEFDKRWDFAPAQGKDDFEAFFKAKPAGKPFFLHMGFVDPHRPYPGNAVTPPNDPKQVRLPNWLPDDPQVRKDLADYADEITRMDGECGQVLALLEKYNLADNTIVFFTGDNGMPFPWRAKGTLYEEGIRVPFLVKWPKVVKAGAVSQAMVTHLDLGPTFLEAAGVPVPDWMQGKPMQAVLRGTDVTGRAEIFSERNWHDTFDTIRCVRTATHKLIFNGMPHKGYKPISDLRASPTWAAMTTLEASGGLNAFQMEAFAPQRPVLELYDLQKDPEERVNLAGQPAAKAVEEDLLRRMTNWIEATNDFLPPPFRPTPGAPKLRRSTL